MRTIKTYSELSQLQTFEERYRYVKQTGRVGEETFGFDRYLNQVLYRSPRWRSVRDRVIVRDNGCDLGMPGWEIQGKIIVHHMVVLTIDDILNESEFLFDPEYLISTSHNTHQAIHYGDESLLITAPIERSPNDTRLW